MPVKWDDKMDIKFLCTILKVLEAQVSRETWSTIAATMGSDFTLEACRLHYAKIQKDAGVENVVPATPAAATNGAPKAGRKRKQPIDEDGPFPERSPRKSKKASSATSVKKEGENGFASAPVKLEYSASAGEYDEAV